MTWQVIKYLWANRSWVQLFFTEHRWEFERFIARKTHAQIWKQELPNTAVPAEAKRLQARRCLLPRALWSESDARMNAMLSQIKKA